VNLAILRRWDCCRAQPWASGSWDVIDRGADVKQLTGANLSRVGGCIASLREATQIQHATTRTLRVTSYSLCIALESLWGHYVQTGLCTRTRCASLLRHSGRRQGGHSLANLLFQGGSETRGALSAGLPALGITLSKSVFLCVVWGTNG
jgi:hypothetical protein